jgi:hypothetical protein
MFHPFALKLVLLCNTSLLVFKASCPSWRNSKAAGGSDSNRLVWKYPCETCNFRARVQQEDPEMDDELDVGAITVGIDWQGYSGCRVGYGACQPPLAFPAAYRALEYALQPGIAAWGSISMTAVRAGAMCCMLT